MSIQPYPERDGTHTSGHSGGETSRDSVIAQDQTGKTGTQQRQTLGLAGTSNVIIGRRTGGTFGITCHEVAAATDMHHGQASRSLTVLHKAGLICRLRDKRGRASIYVLPEYVQGRETIEPRTNKAKPLTPAQEEAFARISDRLEMFDGLGTQMATVRTSDLHTLVKAIGECK